MPTTPPPPEFDTTFWLSLAGGVLLVVLGLYGLLTQLTARPQYPAALLVFGLAGLARAVAPISGSRVVENAPFYLTGAALGLLLLGLIA